ncbi:hypothetical protein [Gracilibacillus sp. JCM 18860]|uniref:hypothetical protein n=1 Tax=Gracilibacillus sp. JCM 18860 TaxID=1306159 RepID=UPI0032604A91
MAVVMSALVLLLAACGGDSGSEGGKAILLEEAVMNGYLSQKKLENRFKCNMQTNLRNVLKRSQVAKSQLPHMNLVA